MFFTFDGIDGAGKSTQIRLFVEWLESNGHSVTNCRDPGTTAAGEAIRGILLGTDFRIDYRAEMLLYMASRAQLVSEVIRPALKRGDCVVSDRYLLASVVYQGSAGDIEPDEIWKVGEIATESLLPDLTFVLDLEPCAAAHRLGDKQDRIESRGLEYFTRVREGFLSQAQRFPDSHAVIDASQGIDAIQSDIRAAYTNKLEANQ